MAARNVSSVSIRGVAKNTASKQINRASRVGGNGPSNRGSSSTQTSNMTSENLQVRSQTTYFVKDFDEDGRKHQKKITLAEKIQIDSVNTSIAKIGELLAKCRRLVGSFKHNDLLNRNLKATQLRQLSIKTNTCTRSCYTLE